VGDRLTVAIEIQAIEATEATDHELTLAWRLEQLSGAGFDTTLAAELALSNVDLHDAIDLVQWGCDPALVARILL
jgi:hypothetical protein